MFCAGSSARILCLVATLVLCCSNQPLFADSSVGFELVNGQFIVVSVFINNSGPYDFMLDTGSNVTLVDPDLIARLDRVFLGNKRLETPAGSRSVPCFRLEELRLGSRRVESLDVLVLPVVSLKGKRVSGLVGQDFLENFNYVLDYKNKQIVFEDKPRVGRAPIQQGFQYIQLRQESAGYTSTSILRKPALPLCAGFGSSTYGPFRPSARRSGLRFEIRLSDREPQLDSRQSHGPDQSDWVLQHWWHGSHRSFCCRYPRSLSRQVVPGRKWSVADKLLPIHLLQQYEKLRLV
jgi:Aspartyl protease